MPLARRLLIAPAAVAAGATILLIVAGVGLMILRASASGLVSGDISATSLLLNLDRDAYQAQLGLERAAAAHTPADRADHLDAYAENRDQTGERFDQYVEVSRRYDGEESRWPTFESARADWTAAGDAVIADLESGADPTASLAATKPLFEAFRTVGDDLFETFYAPEIDGFPAALNRSVLLAMVLLLVTFAAALVVGYVVTMRTARHLTGRMERLTTLADDVAAGRLDADPIDEDDNDELSELATAFDTVTRSFRLVAAQADAVADGDLTASVLDQRVPGSVGAAVEKMVDSLQLVAKQADAIAACHLDDAVLGAKAPGGLGESMNSMVDNLTVLLGRIRDSADALTDASDSLSGTSRTVGELAVSSGDEATAAATATEHIDVQINAVADSLIQVTSSIAAIANSTEDAARKTADVVQLSRQTGEVISRLDASSREISAVVKAVRDVADQTNLLALNAAIEAARAGEAGRGFAVVAGEVKALAEQTADSTLEIADRIAQVQSQCNEAVAANDQIAGAITELDTITSAIAAAAQEQTASTTVIGDRVEAAVDGSRQITDRVASLAEASATTRDASTTAVDRTAELTALAAELNSAVSTFRL